MVKPALQAAEFVERLPRRPYCTDDLSSGLLIRPQATALAYRHIQHNPPPHVSCIVFDVIHVVFFSCGIYPYSPELSVSLPPS